MVEHGWAEHEQVHSTEVHLHWRKCSHRFVDFYPNCSCLGLCMFHVYLAPYDAALRLGLNVSQSVVGRNDNKTIVTIRTTFCFVSVEIFKLFQCFN